MLIKLGEKNINQRIDIIISENLPDISRTNIQRTIKTKNIKYWDVTENLLNIDTFEKEINNIQEEKINLKNYKIINAPNYIIKNIGIIEINFEEKINYLKPAYNIKLDIIYEDEDLIIINKPANVTTHPGSGNYNDTLLNNLIGYLGLQNLSNPVNSLRPGIIHRLDKDTTGLIIIAKNDFSHNKLSKAIEMREISRKYKAIIWGSLEKKSGKIEGNIARSKKDPTKMVQVRNSGKHAITYYKLIEDYNYASLIECTLETGRTHQIRVHLSNLKHPVIGDQLYGKDIARPLNKMPLTVQNYIKDFKRQALHAYSLSFIHPRNGESLNFSIDLPEDMLILKNLLKEDIN